MEQKSHGEGFLQIITSRIINNGVYVLDEPEASLSPNSAIYFINDEGIKPINYEDTEHYQIYKSFLENRERFLKYL